MLHHQLAKLADCRFVGNRLLTQVDTNKLAQGAGILARLFSCRVGPVEPVLKKMDSQQSLEMLTGPRIVSLGG